MSPSDQKTLVSGMQPTGELHLGNYLGALKNWVRLQHQYDCLFFVADYYALTIAYHSKDLPARVKNLILTYLAAGLNPEKCTLFIQSHIPQHAELGWIFTSLAMMSELERMTQYKDKSKQHQDNINAGLFTYPALMTADILMYKAQGVPVGEDQTQHVELTRVLAKRFNTRFGNTFPEPQVILTPTPRVMSLADPNKKMSKSLGDKHYISLFDAPKTIERKVMSAVTDTKPGSAMSLGVKNLFILLEACEAPTEIITDLNQQHTAGTLKYVDLKKAVAETIIKLVEPIQEKLKELEANPSYVAEVITAGTARARALAQATMKEVKQKCGLL